MSTSAPERPLEERVERLEQELGAVITRLGGVRVAVPPRPRQDPPPRPERIPAEQRQGSVDTRPASSGSRNPGPIASGSPDPAPVSVEDHEASLGDRIGGRGLAWIGGIATLIGIVLLLALAISHGWIGQDARVVMAALGAAGLMACGSVMRRRRISGLVAAVMVGTGTAGMFATLMVATSVYELVDPWIGIVGALLTGGIATMLAIRWAGVAIGAIGLLGAIASPAIVAAPIDGTAVAVLWLTTACATAVVVWRRWTWLAAAAPVISAAQWIAWAYDGPTTGWIVGVLTAFAALGLLGAIGAQARTSRDSVHPAAAILVCLNACITAVIGYGALRHAGADDAAKVWLAGLTVLHIVPAIVHGRHIKLPRRIRELLLVLAAILADVAFGVLAGGFVLTVGWAVAAVGFAALIRLRVRHSDDEVLFGVGLGAHVGLVLLRTLLVALPPQLNGDGIDVIVQATIATLAATCIAGARIVGPDRQPFRVALDALGLAAIAYLTGTTLHGVALVIAWTAEAATLAELARRGRDAVAGAAAAAFLGAAVTHALVVEAPLSSLVSGAPSVGAAALALGAISVALVRASRLAAREDRSPWSLIGGAAVTFLYLASVLLIGAFQPTAGMADPNVLDLTVRQLGQALLSAMWSIGGLATLIVGLRRRIPQLRLAGLVLLLVTAAKVFLYDLSTLTSIYRVISFIVLGLLLLAGAAAYQRLRPMDLQ